MRLRERTVLGSRGRKEKKRETWCAKSGESTRGEGGGARRSGGEKKGKEGEERLLRARKRKRERERELPLQLRPMESNFLT